MPKTDRIEMRADPADSELIRRAADAVDQTVSSFALNAARSEASRVLARSDATIMPADQFDALMASLDAPEDVPNLAKLANKRRRFVRR